MHSSRSQVFIKGMAHDETVATQKTGKTASPPKDQPAPCPYPDWSTMQAYYGPSVLPPTYFTPGIAPGHAPPPYMWGPQPLMPPTFGTPYAAMYPHVGAYPHPLVPMMANPLSLEPTKSANSKEKSSNKKLKEIDGTAASVGSGNSKKTMSSSGDYSAEGSSDVNDLKASKTPWKRSLDGPGAETTAAAKMEDAIAPNHILENTAMLPNHRFPAPVIKPSATNAANSRAVGTPISPTPRVMVSSHTGVSTELSIKDERELKRERRKQSNRESARRSRLRKQAEIEELATQVESLTAENTSLRSEISRLTESSENLRSENSALMVKLKDTAATNNAEVSMDKTAASSSPRVVENFLSMIDNTNKTGISRHTEHGEPKLRQLLGPRPATDVVAGSSCCSHNISVTV